MIGGLGIVVVVGTFVFILPRIADYRSVWDVVQDLTWQQIALLVLATVLNLATYAPPWMAALPGLGFRQAIGAHAGVDRLDLRRAGRRGRRDGDLVRDAPRLGVRGAAVTIAVAVTGSGTSSRCSASRWSRLPALTLQHERNGLLQTVALIGLVVFVRRGRRVRGGLWTPNGSRVKVGDLGAAGRELGIAADPPGPVELERRVVRPLPQRDGAAARAALARAHARDARRPAHGVPRDARLAARLGVTAAEVSLNRGVRRLVDRRDCSARCRSRRAGSGSSRWG